MTIEGVGVDMVEIDRIKAALQKWGDNLEKRILASQELRVVKDFNQKAVFLAGRFAAKEAIFKALEINPDWHEVLVLTGKKGEPVVILSSKILKRIERKVKKVLVSISHCKSYALAQAMVIG
ncbi:holo-ACP synthase [Candidatus Aerophobetes bacterium]|nr:holo-ACP synthase [Candidatus Aerophobetes bacterium]